VVLLLNSLGACGPSSTLPEVQANDNRTPAGTLRGDTLFLSLVAGMARWHPEAPDGPSADVAALGEEGGPPQVPAPLIRVPTGAIIQATVRNALTDSTLQVVGLSTRPMATLDSIAIAPGESRSVTFAAGEPGTYMYGALVGNVDRDNHEREQVFGAFVVDSAASPASDRVFVMNIWGQQVDSTTYRNILAINGKSFPATEEIAATIGDTVRWRWVNASIRNHPMHLHGFFFTVEGRGSFRRDTLYGAANRRTVVTEVMQPFSTMAMTWSPDRDGHWLFHCHIAFHSVMADARLDPPPTDHMAMGSEPGEHMAGLVLGLNVTAPPGWVPPPRENPRALRLFVQEGPKRGRADRTMRYAVERFGGEPDSTFERVTGAPLVLTRGQPTDITVINQLSEPTALHWHGLELESWSDGVAGWSGHAGMLAPLIAPADSFVARLTLARAGTFIYHTHFNDAEELTSGLYGPIIVIEPGDVFDSSRDHVFLAGWDGPEDPPHLLVNGDSILPTMTWRLGGRHRLRFLNMGLAVPITPVITLGADTVTWRAIAKDGAELPMGQRVTGKATTAVFVGETADFEFTPPRRGEYLLAITAPGSRPPVVQRIVVR